MPDSENPNEPTHRPRHAPDAGGYSAAEIVAAALAVIWVAAVGIYFWTAPSEGGTDPGPVLMLMVIFLPLALIWAAVTTFRSVRMLRAEAARLQSTVDAMRNAYLASQQSAAAAAMKPSVEKRLDEIAHSARQTETAIVSFTSRRDSSLSEPSADRKAALAPARMLPADEQPTLALGTPAESLRPPLSVADFIRALEFPESPDDRDGFRALRLALEDRSVAKLVRAAQDALTLLAQEGIYMDDLKPDRARPELWRRFAAGERGRTIAALGGVRDRSSLALTAGRMREDPVFRDAAHHFLRAFDRTFAEFAENATDTEIAELADTRTARAFMLFGRVAGIFD